MPKNFTNFTFYWNSFPEDWDQLLTLLTGVSYMIVAETSTAGGTPCLQGYIVFRTGRPWCVLNRTFGPRWHIQAERPIDHEKCIKEILKYRIVYETQGSVNTDDLPPSYEEAMKCAY